MRAVFVGLASVLVGLSIFEVTMQPENSERLELGLIFGVLALLMGIAAVWLPEFSKSLRSVRWTFGILSVVSFGIVVVGVVAVAGRMFLSEHDVTLLLVVLGFGVVSSVGFAISVSRPISDDLVRLAGVADQIATGSLDLGTRIERQDEVGRLASSIDQMVVRLEAAETERKADTEARKSFFAAVGHDLRSPLASLQAAVEAIQDGVADDPSRFIDSMEREIGVLSALVEDIYLLARIESGGFDLDTGVVDLAELADEAIEVVRPLAERKAITLRLESSVPVVARGGDFALGRVFRNLLDNAVRHSPPGSEVIVTLGSAESPSVTVTDQGAGFDPAFVETAFERFSRSDPARVRDHGGSGLGLAIAGGFVTALKGEIWAEPGPGGKVGFRLPPVG